MYSLTACDDDHSREIAQLFLEHDKHASQLVAGLDEAKVQYLNELLVLFVKSAKHDAILWESILM